MWNACWEELGAHLDARQSHWMPTPGTVNTLVLDEHECMDSIQARIFQGFFLFQFFLYVLFGCIYMSMVGRKHCSRKMKIVCAGNEQTDEAWTEKGNISLSAVSESVVAPDQNLVSLFPNPFVKCLFTSAVGRPSRNRQCHTDRNRIPVHFWVRSNDRSHGDTVADSELPESVAFLRSVDVSRGRGDTAATGGVEVGFLLIAVKCD